MRARVYSNGGNSTGGFTFNGGTLTGALFLAGNPSEPLEAASKQYLDSSLVNLNASNISSGILPSGRLPTFVGDLIKPAGSSTINLAPIGVVAGDYIKPTVDAKGRVTGGSSLVEADIPNISWDKVSLNRPVTLSGYGINNAIPLSGGTLTGFLSFNGSVTGNLQAVTKQYIDVTLSTASGIAIGDIIRKPYSTTPAGFLKCNGGEVNKTTYNSLYATIGDRFSKKQSFTSGRPWEQQYNINEIQYNDINNWVTDLSVTPIGISLAQIIITKNRVYAIGIYATSGPIANIYTTSINSDGTLGSWTTSTSLPSAFSHSTSIIIKNKIYLFGGLSAGSAISTVYSTTINSDGTLGTWITETPLPGSLSHSRVVVTNNRVYLLGGINNSSPVSVVYMAMYDSSGKLSSWSIEASLPLNIFEHSIFITKNRVYLCGGHITWPSPVSASVYTTTINSDGTLGTWVSCPSLPIAVGSSTPYVTKNRVYLFGGHNGSSYVSTVLTATINSDGTLGSWIIGTNLPASLGQSKCIATKNHIYLVAGSNTSGVSSIIYSASISGGLNDYSSYYAEDTTNYMMPGSGKPWQQQYQINTTQTADITGWVATTSLPEVLYLSQVIVTKNRVHVLNGYNGTTSVATVYTAPINADGTLGAWTTGAALPGHLRGSQPIITKNRVYLLGGHNGTAYVSTVYTAPINSDGTLGTWTTGSNIPSVLDGSHCIITKNRVYLLGGWNGSNVISSVYTAPVNTDGTLGTWTTSTSLPGVLCWGQAVVTKNRVYLIGGKTTNGNSSVSTVYTASINSDGLIGVWSTGIPIPQAISQAQCIVTNNRVYLLGGHNGTTAVSTVYMAVINSDGTLGSWSISTSLPSILLLSQAIITKNHVYLLGGHNGTTAVSTVYMASILEGLNDYSSYYDGTIVPNDAIDTSTTFALPDLTQSEKFDTVSYIKY